MRGFRTRSWRAGAAALAALALGACGTPRLGSRPQPDADLSGRWVLESGDDALLARMGKGAEIYLASPATVVASAIAGCIANPRDYL